MTNAQSFVPHIRFCTTSKSVFDVLKNLYAQRTKARFVMLKWKLEETRMQKGESMDAFLTKIRTSWNNYSALMLVSKVLAPFPDSYEGFATI